MSKIFITEYFLSRLDKDEAKFLLEHAEKQLKDILDTGNLITGRCTTLLTLTVGFVIALFGYSVSKWAEGSFNEVILTGFIVIVYLVFTLFYMGKNIQPTQYMSVGAEPKLFFTEAVFNDKNKAYRLKAIYANEIEQYQIRIEENKTTNEERWKIFNASFKLVKLTPLVMISAYALSRLILYPWY